MSSAVGRLVVERGDRRLDLIGPDLAGSKGLLEQCGSFVDGGAVPQRAILLGHWDDGAVGGHPGRAPSVGEQHQGEQAGRLGIAWELPTDHAGESDRLLGQLDPVGSGAGGGGVSLVEDEVERVQHRVEAFPELGRRRACGTARRSP